MSPTLTNGMDSPLSMLQTNCSFMDISDERVKKVEIEIDVPRKRCTCSFILLLSENEAVRKDFQDEEKICIDVSDDRVTLRR